MTLSHVAYVALGGALGAVGRYAVLSAAGALIGHGFPFGTLIVNILGSFLLGVFIEISALVWSPSPEMRAMIVVGVLGAFTTFSTFSQDFLVMMQRGETLTAFVYVGMSVIFSIAALWLGMSATRVLLA